MFFTIDDIVTSKKYNVSVIWITSLKNGDDTKTAPNFELLLYHGDGGRPLVESFSSAAERRERREAILEAGSFFILDDIHYNVVWVQSIGKIKAGDILYDGNLAQKSGVYVTFANGRTLYGMFDTEAERDEFYETLRELTIGGGLVQEDSQADFPTQGNKHKIYLAKDTGQTYYWDEVSKTYMTIGTAGKTGVYSTAMKLPETIGASKTIKKSDLTEILKPSVPYSEGSEVIGDNSVHGIIVSSTATTVEVKTITDLTIDSFRQVEKVADLPKVGGANILYYVQEDDEFRIWDVKNNVWEEPFHPIIFHDEKVVDAKRDTFYVVGNKIKYTTDNVNWIEMDSEHPLEFADPAVANAKVNVLYIDNGKAKYTIDNVNWTYLNTDHPIIFGDSPVATAKLNTLYVAGNTIKYTTDNVNWVEISGGAAMKEYLSNVDLATAPLGATTLNVTDTNIVDIKDVKLEQLIYDNKGTVGRIIKIDKTTGELKVETITISGSGGGIKDLSGFTTDDLAEGKNNKYMTAADKANISNVIGNQTQISSDLNNIKQLIPSEANSSNKLVDKNQMNKKFTDLKLVDLADVDDSNMLPGTILSVDNSGSKVIFKQSSDFGTLKTIEDKLGKTYSDVSKIKFLDLSGKRIDGTNSVELSLGDMFTTDLKDMPQSYENGKVLVANQGNMNYELKDIGELTNSKENFVATIDISDWVHNVEANRYEKIINHELKSKNLIVAFYNGTEVVSPHSYKILDENNIAVYSENTDACKVVINCSQGTVGDGTGSGGGGSITAGDFIDDYRKRLDKTYSSSKIESLLIDYALKDNVYSKVQADALFALKGNEHKHSNLQILNGLTDDASGALYYKGVRLMTGFNPSLLQKSWNKEDHTDLSLLCDIRQLFQDNNMNVIMSSEFLIRNEIESVDPDTDAKNKLNLVISENNIVVLNVEIDPSNTQKYILGISPDTKIMVKGSFTANLNINYY